MKVIALVVLGLFALSPLALAGLDTIGIGPGFEAKAPEWEAGYSWTWDMTSRGRASGEGFGLVQLSSQELRGEATRFAEVLNTTQTTSDGQALVAVLEAFQVDLIRYGDKTLYDGSEGSDHQDAARMFQDGSFCLTPCGTFLAHYTPDGNLHVGAAAAPGDPEELRLLDFPLTRGKTWTVAAFEEGGIPFQVAAKAVEVEYVNLKGFSPMQAVRIEAKVTDETKDALKNELRQAASEEGIDLSVDFDLRFTYWYAPEVQNVIKTELDGFFAARGKGYGAAGSGRVDFHIDQVLREAHLVAGPERSLDEAVALTETAHAEGGEAVRPSAEKWPFQVGASAHSVDATHGSEVQFGVAAAPAARAGSEDVGPDAFMAPPEGSRVAWTHQYVSEEGPQRVQAEGPETTFRIETPGLHTVTATVYDRSGRVMGASHTIIEGYTVKSVQAKAPAGLGLGLEDTLRLDAFIAPGVLSAQIQLDPEGIARGTLQVDDHVAAHTLDRPHYFVTVPAGDTIEVVWKDEARAGGLTMTLEVRYDRNALPPPGTTDPNGVGVHLWPGALTTLLPR